MNKNLFLLPYLPTSQSHSRFSHSVGTREVQLQSVGSRGFSLLGQHGPVTLIVRAHDGGYQDLKMREVRLGYSTKYSMMFEVLDRNLKKIQYILDSESCDNILHTMWFSKNIFFKVIFIICMYFWHCKCLFMHISAYFGIISTLYRKICAYMN